MKSVYKLADDLCEKGDIKIYTSVCTPFCVLNPNEYKHLKLTSCTQTIEKMQALLDMNGNIRICNHSPHIIGNIFKDSWESIVNSEYLKQWKIRPEYCKTCTIFHDCKGGCRAASEQAGLGVGHVDPIVTIYRK